MHGTPQAILQGLGAAGAGLAGDSTSDKFTFTVPHGRWIVKGWSIGIRSASTHATALKVALDHRVTAESDTGRVELSTITKTTAVNQQGKTLWQNLATRKQVKGGEQLVAEVVTANGDACLFTPTVILEEDPETFANLTTHVEKTA